MAILVSCRGDDDGPGAGRCPNGSDVEVVSRAAVNADRMPSYAGLPGRGPLNDLAHLVAGQAVGSLPGQSSVFETFTSSGGRSKGPGAGYFTSSTSIYEVSIGLSGIHVVRY